MSSTSSIQTAAQRAGDAGNAPTRDQHGFISNLVEPERAVLAQLILAEAPSGLPPAPDVPPEDSSTLEELGGLTEAAGAVTVGSITQRRQKPDPATLFGKGKVQEIADLCKAEGADVVIVDHDLSPAQGRNLEKALDVRVIDRTELILDIFARRAQTRQAKLQVELAQLRYQLPRLKRMWTHLERTGGGIGTRGPGETQLETDRTLARDRVTLLEKQLANIRRQKAVESVGRLEFETGALVGYTNVGKSALLNALSRPTGKGVLVKDQLFATLGASTRKVELGGGRGILLSDTVGFVRRLPHHLVESFHSTLAEVENSDLLLFVSDAADPELDDKLRSVERVLGELGVIEKPHLLVLNQCDRLDAADRAALMRRYPEAVLTSALTGEGMDALKTAILSYLERNDEEINLVLDARDEYTGKLMSDIARHGQVLHQEWSEDGQDGTRPRLHVRARLAPRWIEQLELSKMAASRR